MFLIDINDMNDQERKADFERAAQEFWRWEMTGEDLLQASDHLYPKYLSAIESMREQVTGTMPQEANFLTSILFLRAIGLENLLKGLYVKKGNSVTNGNGSLNFHGHNLTQLCADLSIPVTDTIEKLSQSIYSWGRYPLPMNYRYWRKEVPGFTGVPPIFTWTSEDQTEYKEVLAMLRQRLKS